VGEDPAASILTAPLAPSSAATAEAEMSHPASAPVGAPFVDPHLILLANIGFVSFCHDYRMNRIGAQRNRARAQANGDRIRADTSARAAAVKTAKEQRRFDHATTLLKP
jgi:hypothetical protein